MALIIGTGLFWRSGILPLSPFASKYGGDALWALLIFVGFGAIFPKGATLSIGLAAIGYSFATEFFQLVQTPGLESIRGTRLGHLVLGSSFNWPDLIAYTLGVAIGAALEIGHTRFRQRKATGSDKNF